MINLSSTVSNLMSKVQWKTFPIVEVIIFVIFAWFVFYRRRLSSNDEYRSTKKKKFPHIATQTQALIMESIEYMTKEMVLPSYSLKRNTMKHTRLRFHNSFNSLTTSSTSILSSSESQSVLSDVNLNKSKQHHIFMNLSDDIMFKIIDFLSMKDLITMSTTCYDLNIYLHSDLVWKHMWMIRFGNVWKSKQIMELRQLRGIKWDITEERIPINHSLQQSFLPSASTAASENSSENANKALKVNVDPKLGWMRFYIDFEYSWLDWLLAGFNTDERCLIGLHGCVLDITSFLDEHPGSPESLKVTNMK